MYTERSTFSRRCRLQQLMSPWDAVVWQEHSCDPKNIVWDKDTGPFRQGKEKKLAGQIPKSKFAWHRKDVLPDDPSIQQRQGTDKRWQKYCKKNHTTRQLTFNFEQRVDKERNFVLLSVLFQPFSLHNSQHNYWHWQIITNCDSVFIISNTLDVPTRAPMMQNTLDAFFRPAENSRLSGGSQFKDCSALC